MRKTKSQKGITLIALIITIIVLLILAVVAIGAVQNDGIIGHAKNARDEYSTAQATENSTIQSYLDKIQEHVGTGTGVASGTGTGGNQGTEVTFTIDGKQYKAAPMTKWEQWCEGQEDYYISEDNGMVMCRGTENKGVYCKNCDAQKYGDMRVNFCPGCGASDSWTHDVDVTSSEEITFYYNGFANTAKKGDRWIDWDEYGMAGCDSEDGYLMIKPYFICYDDGTWVKTDDEIRERTLLYKTV